jgi:CHAT domain-containing protein
LTDEALNYYQQAIASSSSIAIQIQAQLNQFRVLIDTKQWLEAETLVSQIQSQLQKLPASRTSVYALINFVHNLHKLEEREEVNKNNLPTNQQSAQILAQALEQAKSIGDERAQSYALGSLGELYEKTQQWSMAQNLTEKALILAQANNAPDIAYRWQWQLGRLLKDNGKTEEAIAAYDEAVKTLDYIRNDLVASNLDIQFSFREKVEPVYRELVSLLLEEKPGEKSAKVNQKNLKKARQVMESLQLAELDNYFQEPCLKASPTQIDQVDSQAAVIYPIILPDRLEIILSLPHQPLRQYTAAASQADIETMVEKMRRTLKRSFLEKQYLAIAKQVHSLLIQPLEADLQANGIKTLVFVLDGSLKNLPMAALYDGKQYLIEKYSIALTPGMQLLTPRPLERQQMKILIGGLSEGRQGFVGLPSVAKEIEQIKSGISTYVLFNKTFTSVALKKQIEKTPFPVVHLATHGEFSSKAEDTFVLTWDNRLNVKQLGEILQSREQDSAGVIELLVLSACKTASGDKRAPLGLAGIAIRSGARSTVASLWSVDDQSTSELMVEFYKQLANTKVTKAEALRNAQLQLLKKPGFKHPYYWSPFVLVGNWL